MLPKCEDHIKEHGMDIKSIPSALREKEDALLKILVVMAIISSAGFPVNFS